jgi:hypothetical protein
MANGCKRKTKIFSLKNGDYVIQGDEALFCHATQFYKNLSGPAEDRGVRLSAEVWSNVEKLNDTDRVKLGKKIY